MTGPAPRLRSLATAVPPHALAQEEVIARAARLLPGYDEESLARLMPVYENAGVRTRYSCVPPEWYEASHGWAEKNRLYLEHALALGERSAREAMARAGVRPDEVDALVSVSTTGIATPSLDAVLAERLGLRPELERLPIFGLGCAGGVLGLARAATLARAQPGKVVLLLVVELCALTFRRDDRSKANVIATALFGDGAAAAVLRSEDGRPEVEHSGEYRWPDSLDVMGWQVEDDGLGVLFSRDIPSLVRSALREAAVDFLAARGLTPADVDGYVCHPGGARVMDALEEAFDLPAQALAESRDVLRDYGNMSAATVLFVLERVLSAGRCGRLLLVALGPGFTAAFATLRA